MDTSESVNVHLWELGQYISQDSHLPQLIDLNWLQSLLGMAVVSVGEERRKVWATIDLSKVIHITFLCHLLPGCQLIFSVMRKMVFWILHLACHHLLTSRCYYLGRCHHYPTHRCCYLTF
jgi:hypothetical protein